MYSWSTSLSLGPRASSNPGDVGAHVVTHSSGLGIPVVCADSDEHTHRVSLARQTDAPIVFNDASREDIRCGTSRACPRGRSHGRYRT
jgi:hypothetical protein